MLPVQQLLLVNELGALSVHQLLPEVFVLQQLQHVQAVRVSEEKTEVRGQGKAGFTLDLSKFKTKQDQKKKWSKIKLKRNQDGIKSKLTQD